MILIDRQFLKKQAFCMKIHQMISSISVQDLDIIVHIFKQYAKMNIYFSEKDDWITIILWEIHIVNDLCAKMLIDMNILATEKIIMNLSWRLTVISSCKNVKISLIITIKLANQISQTILAKQCTVVSSWSNFAVVIIQSKLFLNCDFLFESDCC